MSVVPDNHHCITEHCQRASSMQINPRYCPLPIHSSPSRLSISQVKLCHYTFSTRRTPILDSTQQDPRSIYPPSTCSSPFPFSGHIWQHSVLHPGCSSSQQIVQVPLEEKSQVRTPALSAWKEGYHRYQSTDQIFIGLRSFHPVSVGGKRKGSTSLSSLPLTRLFARLLFPRNYPLPRHLHRIL